RTRLIIPRFSGMAGEELRAAATWREEPSIDRRLSAVENVATDPSVAAVDTVSQPIPEEGIRPIAGAKNPQVKRQCRLPPVSLQSQSQRRPQSPRTAPGRLGHGRP